MMRHRVVGFEFLRANWACKGLIGILVLFNMSDVAIFLQERQPAAEERTLKRLLSAMLLRHVRQLCGSMDEDRIALFA